MPSTGCCQSNAQKTALPHEETHACTQEEKNKTVKTVVTVAMFQLQGEAWRRPRSRVAAPDEGKGFQRGPRCSRSHCSMVAQPTAPSADSRKVRFQGLCSRKRTGVESRVLERGRRRAHLSFFVCGPKVLHTGTGAGTGYRHLYRRVNTTYK